MLNGYIGSHIRCGGGGGFSVDRARQVLAVMGGKFHVVVNDDVTKQPTPQYPDEKPLSRHILEAGGIVAARFTLSVPGDDARDDDADAKFRGDELADIQINLLNQIGKHENLFAYGGNELGDTQPARQEEFLVTYLDRLGHNGYRAVIGNYAYLNPTYDLFASMPRAVAAAERWKAYWGFHWGTTQHEKSYEAARQTGAIGDALKWATAYGFRLWITEFAGSYSPHDGYRKLYEDNIEEWYEVLYKTVVNICRERNVPIDLFTMFDWQRFFSYYDDANTLKEIGALNRTFPVLQVPETPSMPKTVYAPDYICPNGSAYGVLSTDENVYCRTVDGRQMQWKNELGEQFIVRPGAIERGADWSSLWTADGKYHGFFYVQYKKKPQHPQDGWGAVWVEDYLTEGEEKTFPCWIVEYWWDGSIKAGPVESPNRIKFVKHHATFTLPGGIVVEDVIELEWRGQEHYFYMKGFGLIMWKNVISGATNYLVRGASGPAKAPIYPIHMPPTSWRNETVATLPAGENPYEAVVTEAVKLRPNPGTASTNLFNPPIVLPKDAHVTAFELPLVEKDGYIWVQIESALGNGWSALTYLRRYAPPPKEEIIFRLNMLYASQVEARDFINDCGPACCKMLIDFWYLVKKLLQPTFVTVNLLARQTDLANRDDGLGCGELVTLLRGFGVDAVWLKGQSDAQIETCLRSGRPVIALVNSKHIGYSTEFGHFVVINGITTTGWLVQDPYTLGPDRVIGRDAMNKALTEISRFSPQGSRQIVTIS